MHLATINTRTIVGVDAQAVSVEVHIAKGLPAFSIVGLPEAVVRESKDRVRSALTNSGYEFPYRKITVNLAPANLPKNGCGFDLPIAIGILAASQQIKPTMLHDYEFIGELALDGSLRPVKGMIPVVIAAKQDKRLLITSSASHSELCFTSDDNTYIGDHLLNVCDHLNQRIELPKVNVDENHQHSYDCDWNEIKGQQFAKRALEVAACGKHNVLMSGPPGSGKTMLAQRFHTILPLNDEKSALESAAIASIHGIDFNDFNWRQAPYRAPHHTASQVALVGGGSPPRPGEISLAHNGILFLDELPEFSRRVLETLREPLESGHINISRAARVAEFPAQFQLIAAMNPCPCGHASNPHMECSCSADQINRYRSKLSGPLLDRIDLHLHVEPLSDEQLTAGFDDDAETSEAVRTRVEKVQVMQLERQQKLNSQLSPKETEALCQLTTQQARYLSEAIKKFKLSARAYHRLLRVARTIADIEACQDISLNHIQQSLCFRQLT